MVGGSLWVLRLPPPLKLVHNIVLQSCKYLPRLAQMSLVLKQEHVLLHNLSEYKILKFSMRKDAKNIIFICED
jgi:hypothetical protein